MTIKLMDKAFTHGWMDVPMKAPGKTTTCMVKEHTHGAMGGSTRESTTWIRNMGMVYTSGLMAGGMKAIGKMGNNMVKANTSCKMVMLKLVYGKMEKE